MSLDQLKDQVAHLLPQQQRDFQKELAAKIDDSDPAHWIELDDLRQRKQQQ